MGLLVMDIRSGIIKINNSYLGYKCKLPLTSYSQQSGEVIKFRFEVAKPCLE